MKPMLGTNPLLLILFALLANMVFWGGLFYGCLWCLKHFGIIG